MDIKAYFLTPYFMASLSIPSYCLGGQTPQEERQYLLKNNFIQDFQPEQVAYPIEGIALGQGWNLVTGRRTQGTCIEGGVPADIPGSSTTTQYKYLFDREQLYNSLGITASASYGGFGWNASVSTSFSETSLSDRSKTRILSTTLVDKGGWQLTPEANRMYGIRVSDNAKKILESQGGSAQFKKLCGDGFVMAIRKGGQLDVIYELSTSLSDNKSKFNLTMSASGYGATANMSLDKERREELNSDSSSIKILQSGGTLSSPTTKEAVISKIENFPNMESSAAAPYRLVIWPYLLLPNWQEKYLPEQSLLNTRAAFMAYQRLTDLSALYSDAQLRPELYYFPFFPGGLKSDVLKKQAGILRAATRCYESKIASCIKDGKCDFNSESPPACPLTGADEKYTFNDIFLTNALIYGAPLAIKALDIKSDGHQRGGNRKLSIGGLDDSLNLIISNSSDGAEHVNGEDQPLESKSQKWVTEEPYSLYYALLAMAPMKRAQLVDSQGKISLSPTGDEAKDALDLCKAMSFKGECILDDNAYYKALFESNIPADKKDMQKEILRKWVINSRLLPLAQTFCAESLNHPMCRSPEQVIGYIPRIENITIGADANFIPKPATPLPPPKPPAKPPREWDPRPCPPRLCL